MPIERHLGAAWTVLRGPHEPQALLRWVLDAGFAGVLPGPALRAIDWGAVHRAAADLPVDFPAVRAFGLQGATVGAGLVSTREGEQSAALRAVAEAVALGHRLGVPRVLLDLGHVTVLGDPLELDDLGDPGLRSGDPAVAAARARCKVGREAAMDRACRVLHALGRRHPEVTFVLALGRKISSVADARAIEAICEDLGRSRLGYWHDAAVAWRRQTVLGEDPAEALEVHCNRLVGMTLSDASPDGLYLPPGAGGVDWPMLASYVQRSGKPLPAVVELDPAVDPGELPGIRSCLDRFGL